MASLLELEELQTHIMRGARVVHAVNGVSLRVEAGETVGLVGESGSGKSMIGLSILRLLPTGGTIVGGSIRFESRELVGLEEREFRSLRGAEIGVVFQDPMTSLNPTMTIGRQIAQPYQVHRGVSRSIAIGRAKEMLELVGFTNAEQRLRQYPHELSGGLRQRVMLAMALVCEPKLLIADEPTTALDLTVQEQILELIEDLRQRLGLAVLLITHDLAVVRGRADRVAVVYAGRVVEQGEIRRVFATPSHRYTEALLRSMIDIDQDVDRPLPSIPGSPPDLAVVGTGCPFAPRCRHVLERCTLELPTLEGDPAHIHACFNPLCVPLEREAAGTPAAASHGARPADDRRTLLEVSDLVREFPLRRGFFRRKRLTVKAVSGVSFSIREGDILGVVGESGSGKSTLASLLVGLDNADGGSIRFDGVDVTKKVPRKLRPELQLMFQDPYASLDPRMSVRRILTEPFAIQRVGTRRQRGGHATRLLEEVGLPAEAASRHAHEFSGGQRQRIGLARAIALNPHLLVVDEPVSALDVSVRAQVLNLMKRLHDSHTGMTYVVISHDLAVVKYLADRVLVFYLGKVVEIAPSSSLVESPIHPYTAALIASIPTTEPRGNERREPGIGSEIPSAVDPPSGCRFRTRCPRAAPICAEEEPPLRTFAPNHVAACHFPLWQPAE